MKIKNSTLYIISIIFVFLYLLSFSRFFNSDRLKPFKTALLNPKYKESVNMIELFSAGEDALVIEKKDDFWFVRKEKSDFYAPADVKRVTDFIKVFSNIISMYKISDKLSKNSDYSFNFSVKISYNSTYSEYFFGKQDFSQTLRYFMTGKTAAVYQIGNEFENFITANEKFWAEPEIISKTVTNITSVSDIQRIVINDFKKTEVLTPDNKAFKSYAYELMELRHAGICKQNERNDIEDSINSPILKIKIELGNKDEIELTVFNYSEDFMRLSVFYKRQKITSDVKISKWTFSKLAQKELN